MARNMIDDQESRKQIVKNIETNYFVEASAGSGKTTSLVYRMVKMVEKGIPVEKICTITFTKAAANEFFERFQKLLSIRSGDQPDSSDELMGDRDETTKERCQKALANIDLCFLGTIDSFCNMIAHEMPAELGIPSSSTVISKEEYGQIVKERYYEILRNEKHKLHDLAKRFENLMDDPFESFVSGISKISELRNLTIVFDEKTAKEGFDTYISLKEKTRILDILNKLTSPADDDFYDFSKKASYDANKNRTDIKRELAIKYNYLKAEFNNWESFINDFQYLFIKLLKLEPFRPEAEYTSANEFFKPDEKNNHHFSDDFKNECKALSGKIQHYQHSVFFLFITSVLNDVTDSLKEKGKFQFFDFILYLRNAFRDSALGDRQLIEHIFNRHSYFLLDESQDTNPIQTEMFFYLTSTKKDSDWRKMEPLESSIFIVGDPKQSIYGFRGADVKSYLENKKVFENKNELLVLTKNFRSHASLREWFNETFDEMLNYQDALSKDFALRHLDIPIDTDDATKTIPHSNDVIDGVYRCLVHSANNKNGKPTDCEDVAKLVLDIKNNKTIYRTKYDPDTKKTKIKPDKIQFKDFLIVPFGADMSGLINAFNAYGIPTVVEGKMPFEQAESFVNVLNILFVIKDPTNKSSLIKLLTDLYKFNDSDILQMVNDGFDLEINNPSLEEIAFTNRKNKEIIMLLNDLYKKTLTMSFSSTMQYILNDKAINLFNLISAKDMEYIYYLIEKVKEGEETGSISTFNQLKNYIDLFLSNRDEQRTIRFADEVDRVKISNLHKVKGLQAPIVILARPNRTSKDVNSFINYFDKEPCVKISKIEADGYNQYCVQTNMFDDEYEKWKASNEAEHDRLAYVGATRAEAALIVTEHDGNNNTGHWGKLLDNIDNSRAIPVPTINKEPPVLESVSLGDYHINENCHKQSFDYISPSQSRHSGRNGNKDEIDDAIYDKGGADREAATLKGTMIHKLMECLASSKNNYDVEQLIKNIFEQFGYTKEFDLMLHNVAFKILSGGFEQVNSSLDKDVLKTLLGAKKTWCEVPFSYQSQKGNIVSGIIDVMYLDQDDKYHIIDYKTNVERDVSILEKEYAGQLDQYRYALKKMGIDADAHIYHIDL